MPSPNFSPSLSPLVQNYTSALRTSADMLPVLVHHTFVNALTVFNNSKPHSPGQDSEYKPQHYKRVNSIMCRLKSVLLWTRIEEYMCSFVSLNVLTVMYVPFCVFCLIVLFCVLFVCKCVLEYCHHNIGALFDYSN
jgi:hypothetical protein